MIRRLRGLAHRAVAHLPYSRARGVRATSDGRGNRWLTQAERAATVLDVGAGLALLVSAALSLGALFWASQALFVVGGVVLALAMAAMVAGMWVDRQTLAVHDHVHAHAHRGRADRRRDPITS